MTPKTPFFIADVDGDGNDDLLLNEPARLLWYRLRGRDMVLAREASYERPGSTGMVADVSGDGHPDFFVLMESPEGLMLSCHDWFSSKGPSVPLYTAGPLLPLGGAGDLPARRALSLGSFVAGEGSHPTIFIGLNPNSYEGIARSLLAYDGMTGRHLWRFDFGPYCGELACGMFGPDDPRILLTTVAVATEVSHSGTADSLSYVFCLDPRDGRLLWKREISGYGGRGAVAIADINGDGQNEILVARHLARLDPLFLEDTPPWTVAALSREGEILHSASLGGNMTSMRAVNLDSIPPPEVLVQCLDERLVILGHDLTITRIVEPLLKKTGGRPRIYTAGDLVGDGAPELVCRVDTMLVVRNHKGAPIAVRRYDLLFDAQIARYDGRNHVIVASADSIHVMALGRTPVTTQFLAYSRSLALPALAAAIAGGVGGFHLRRYLKRRGERGLTSDEAQNDLLTAMSAFGHGGSSLKVIDRIRLHLKNWERAQSDSAARDELFARLHETFMQTITPELRHIVMLAHKVGVPEETWSAIMARAERAGEAMEGIRATAAAGSAATQKEHIAEALASLGDVDESVAGIRSYLRGVFRTPFAEAMAQVVERFRDEHGGFAVSLALPSDSGTDAGVFISPVAFSKVIEVLLANSVRAAEGSADPAIAIEARWEGDYCKLDIRDNGCGIPRDDWERVFERSYTTKEEGGFGLYYAREELAKFGGKIHVVASAPGEGTTMRIILRKS